MGLLDRFNQGMTRFSQRANGLLFPGLGVAEDPELARRAQAQAMMQMGMGLLGGGRNYGAMYGAAQQAGYEPIEQARREAAMRAAAANQQAEADYRNSQVERQTRLDQQNIVDRNRDRMYRRFDKEDATKQQEIENQFRQRQLDIQEASARRGSDYAPSYQVVELDDGTIGAFDQRTGLINPTDKKAAPDKATVRNEQQLRKEFRGLQSVKDYETALPLLVSARNAPDNGYGDLQLIYTAGKILDPGSVVREGELQLTVAAGSPMQRILGQTQFSIENGGRLTPEVRKQLLGMLNERTLAYRQAYDRDYNQYADYSRQTGADPSSIVGKHAANAYQKPKSTVSSGVKSYATEAEAEADAKAGKLMRGQRITVGGVPGVWE